MTYVNLFHCGYELDCLCLFAIEHLIFPWVHFEFTNLFLPV